jgi:hypothetical protein
MSVAVKDAQLTGIQMFLSISHELCMYGKDIQLCMYGEDIQLCMYGKDTQRQRKL